MNPGIPHVSLSPFSWSSRSPGFNLTRARAPRTAPSLAAIKQSAVCRPRSLRDEPGRHGAASAPSTSGCLGWSCGLGPGRPVRRPGRAVRVTYPGPAGRKPGASPRWPATSVRAPGRRRSGGGGGVGGGAGVLEGGGCRAAAGTAAGWCGWRRRAGGGPPLRPGFFAWSDVTGVAIFIIAAAQCALRWWGFHAVRRRLCIRYCSPSLLIRAESSQADSAVRGRPQAFYARYRPDKLGLVPGLVQRYAPEGGWE